MHVSDLATNAAITYGAGVLWASRPVVYHSSCISQQTGYQAAYTVSGSQTIRATVLPPPAIVVDRTTVVNGDTVTAHPTASWTSNIIVRYGWEWVADPAPTGGSATFVPGSGCGLRDLTCRLVPHGDGHLRMPDLLMLGRFYQTAVSPTIHVASAHLVLVVDSSHVASGSQVKFTARRGDGQQTVQVQSWVWTPGSTSPVGPLAVDCAGGDSLCLTTLQNTSPADSTGVARTGTMTALAYLGTAAESASVAVTVDRPVAGGGGGCGSPAIASSTVRTESRNRTASATRTSSRSATAPPMQVICVGGGTPSMVLTVTRDTLNPLYPRIRGETVNSVVVPERAPDTATVTVWLTQGGSPVPSGTRVTFRAEWLPSTGAHAHIKNAVRFESADAPVLTTGPEWKWPLFGYFCPDPGCILKAKTASVGTNSSGTASVYVVSGYLGGRALVIASAAVGGQVVEDTTMVGYAVSGLVSLQSRIPLADVYWTGGNLDHAEGMNFYVQDTIASRLQPIVENMWKTVNGQQLYLQYNDASLPNGGTFTVTPSNRVRFEDPYIGSGGHTAHNTGLDQDIGFCYSPSHGENGGANAVGSSTCRGVDTARTVSLPALQIQACLQHGAVLAHGETVNGTFVPTHYHIRFVGSNENAPGC